MSKHCSFKLDKFINAVNNDYLENSEKQAKVKDLEKQIDKMVYKFYDLTGEEIKTIEGVCK